ncbi:WD40 repeat domain-containing protein [Phormidesmis sp. 146-12]
MLIQRTSVIVAVLFFAIATPSLLHSQYEPGRAVATNVTELAQQLPVSAKEEYVTRLFNSSGKKLAEFEGKIYRFSPDGRQLLTESGFGLGRFYLFDLSGKKLMQLEGSAPEFSPDGQRIILGDKGYFQLYDSLGRKLARLPGRSSSSHMFSPDSQRVVTLTDDSAYLFDASGRQLARMQGLFLDLYSGFDADGKRLILNRLDSTTCNLFNSAGQTIAQLPKACSGVSPKGQKFFSAVGTWDEPFLHLYDFSGKKIAQLSGFFSIFDRSEQFILTTDFRGDSSYLYNSAGKKIAQLRGRNGRFSASGKRLVTVLGNTVYLYDVSGKELARLPGNYAAFLPQGDKVVTFLTGKNKQPNDISGGQSRLFDGSGRELAKMAGDLSPAEMILYGAGGTPLPSEAIYSKSFSFSSPDGQRLITSDSQKSYLYDSSGKQVAQLPGLAPEFNSTGQLSTTSKEKIYLFNRSGIKVMEVQGEFKVFSPDGQHLAIVEKREKP